MTKKATKTPAVKPELEEISIEIKSAKLKDDFCNYGYELTKGPTQGDSVNRAGAAIVHDDLKAAFKRLNVHLAVICEEIDHDDISDIEHFENLDFEAEHVEGSTQDRVAHYSVHEFKLSGTGENENVVLLGHKRLSTGEYVKLTTPPKHWEGQYPFVNELRVVVDDLKSEVEQYMNGKAAPKMVQSSLDIPESQMEEQE